HITQLDQRDQPIKVDLTVNAALRKALDLLNRPPLGFIRKVGLDPADIEGHVEADVSLGMMASIERPEDVELHATAKITDAALGTRLWGPGVKNGQLAPSADPTKITFPGTAVIEGIPMKVGWLEQFRSADFISKIDLAGTASAAERAALGFEFRP